MGDLNLTPGQQRSSETILSEEMWEKVLMNLTDPEDVLNARKTCVQFQRILEPRKIEAYLAKTLPVLMNYMDGKSILKCRSVSKGWRGVVDRFFESYFLGRTLFGPPKGLKSFPVTRWHSSLCSFEMDHEFRPWTRDPKRFIREMKDHPRNPFVGRAVHFDFTMEGEEDREFQTFYNFFEIFGKHIWTLELDITSEELLTEEVEGELFRFIIRDVFELAPNLKNLYIKNVPLLTVSMSQNEIRALTPAQALEKLEITDAFMPYQEEDRESEEVEKAILLRHSKSQLSVLHTRSLNPLRNLTYWPNLKELHFTTTERINELDIVFRNLRLPKLELLSISLDNMNLSFAKQEEWWKKGQKIAFKKLFLGLYHLSISSPNLKTLRFGTAWLWEKFPRQALGFPRGLPCPKSIKTIEIEDNFYRDHKLTSDYSFLRRFPQVENIHVFHVSISSGNPKYWGFDRRRYEQMHLEYPFNTQPRRESVKVHELMYDERMYESNIWELIPSLKVFTCHFCDTKSRTYTRSSYERRRLADVAVAE